MAGEADLPSESTDPLATLDEILAGCDATKLRNLRKWQHGVYSKFRGLEADLGLNRVDARPKLLWYYTTGDTLIKLVESGTIWATHVSCLNDNLELDYGLSLTQTSLRDRCVRNDKEKAFREFLIEKLRETSAGSSRCFVVCFSEKENDLSQWRAYSGGENGFSIAFDTQTLENLSPQYTQARLSKVRYGETGNELVCKKLLDTLFELFSFEVAGNGPGDLVVWREYVFRYFVNLSSYWLASMKHPDFEREAEWRLITDLWEQEQNAIKLRFMQKSTMLTRDLPISFRVSSQHKLLPLRKVLVGPSRHPAVSRDSVRSLLRTFHYSCEEISVDCSKTPFQIP